MTSGAGRDRPPRGGGTSRGVSILNGFVGDYLDRRGLPGSIAMTFVHEGRPLALNPQSLAATQPRLTGSLVVLVHGWCCSEDVWRFADGESTYATRLQRDTGATPFAIRYNTGLPILDSGRDLARLLRALVAAYPRPLDEIVLIGHSMGGLVIRAACDTAAPDDAAWTGKVRHVFYLGTPHDGADVARFAQGATRALQSTPNPVVRLVAHLFRRGRDAKEGANDPAIVRAAPDAPAPAPALADLPWLPGARHWVLMGTLTDDPRHPLAQALGDGLVRVPKGAAPGVHGVHGGRGAQGVPGVVVLPGIHHLQLAHDAAVYDTIRRACAGSLAPAAASRPAVRA